MPEYIQIFCVTGKGIFPFKQLHLDECWPADEESASDLAGIQERGVYLKRRIRNKKDLPNKAAWAALGWWVDMDAINIVRI